MAAVSDVPDVTREKMAVCARHRFSLEATFRLSKAAAKHLTRCLLCYLSLANQDVGRPESIASMFGLPILQISEKCSTLSGRRPRRSGRTFGLMTVISLTSKFRDDAVPMAVAALITSAYWFTSSTSFANPAVTIARAMTDTSAGISPSSVSLFVTGQILGGTSATLFTHWLLGGKGCRLSLE